MRLAAKTWLLRGMKLSIFSTGDRDESSIGFIGNWERLTEMRIDSVRGSGVTDGHGVAIISPGLRYQAFYDTENDAKLRNLWQENTTSYWQIIQRKKRNTKKKHKKVKINNWLIKIKFIRTLYKVSISRQSFERQKVTSPKIPYFLNVVSINTKKYQVFQLFRPFFRIQNWS